MTSVNRKFIALIVFMILIAISIIFLKNSSTVIFEKPQSPSEKCGIENCHGSVVCGKNVPEICDMSFSPDDICRKFANCQIIKESCQMIKEPEYDSCTSCLAKCDQDFRNDREKASRCKMNCGS